MTGTIKDRVRRTLRLLGRQYRGRPVPKKKMPILDQLALSILKRGLSPRKAKCAFNRLRSEFVDWNEVRVSPLTEIEEALMGVLGRERAGKASEIKRFLTETFERQHRVAMDYLVDRDPGEVERFLGQFATLNHEDVGQVVSRCFADERTPLSQDVVRVMKRMGLAGNSYSPERAREELFGGLSRGEQAKLNFLLYQHANVVCTVKDYDCFRCVLNRNCERGRERLLEGRRKEKKMAAAKKKGGTKKKACAAPRKGAVKKKTAKKKTAKKK
ncbi:MAG: hypothetical protein HY720_11520 [Planctomycetes bacterium]|nr:hypothetical protein [Planctomycetota bacterium]